ncbi:Terminase-like family protein [Phycisphaerae bacterium RAS1]|nr:Terminase-like family protein [Phycisphaerae bacterium RAS1]
MAKQKPRNRPRRAARPAPAASLPPLPWAQKFLPQFFEQAPARFHDELLSDLADDDRRLIARVAPRGHGKSTLASLAFPLWCLCQERCRNIVIITYESALATQFLRDIRTELESNETIIDAYGSLCAGGRLKRTERMLMTSAGACVQARGSGASLRGVRVGPHRPDLIICDDIEKDERVQSPQQRRKLEHWLRRVVLPALAPRGRLFLLGSIIHHDSLLARLADRAAWPGWDYRVYRAIEAQPRQGGHVLTPLWPQRWPLERLEEERRQIGSLAFEQEYQANPMDESLQVFRPEWMRRYTPDRLREAELAHVIAVDPATGAASGDYFAMFVGAVERGTGTIFVRELTLERIGIVEQVRRITAAFLRWKPVRIAIETVGYQVALKQALEEVSRRDGLFMPLVGQCRSTHKIARISALAPLIEGGRVLFPERLDPEVETQFAHFPKGGHDDAPDVCAMGVQACSGLHAGTSDIGLVRRSNPWIP